MVTWIDNPLNLKIRIKSDFFFNVEDRCYLKLKLLYCDVAGGR